MNTARILATAALITSLTPLVACSRGNNDATAAKEEKSFVAEKVEEAVIEARKELRTGNITISKHEKGLAKAEITPQGDLLIEGKALPLTPEQRKLSLAYREHIALVAESGMEIGAQGAGLATKAMGEAVKGIFNGKSEKEIERSIEAEASKIKVSARKLCDRLPAMMASQQALAAAVPEFKPYASMDQSDIDDCYKEDDSDSHTASTDANDSNPGDMNAAEEAAAAAEAKPAN